MINVSFILTNVCTLWLGWQVDDVWRSPNCDYKYTCRGVEGKVARVAIRCEEGSVCGAKDGLRQCVPVAGKTCTNPLCEGKPPTVNHGLSTVK